MDNILIIYLSGIIPSFLLSINIINKIAHEDKSHLTYGEVVFISLIGLLSYAGLIVPLIVLTVSSDWFNTPIKKNKHGNN